MEYNNSTHDDADSRIMPISKAVGIFILLMFSICHAAEDSSNAIAAKTAEAKQQIKFLDDEIALTIERRQDAVRQLKEYEVDIVEKRKELEMAQNRYVNNPSPENKQFLRNAEKRIELAKVTIESRASAIERFQAKEQELLDKQESLGREIASLTEQAGKQRLAEKVESKTQAIKNEMEVVIAGLRQQVETLQRENERLRRVALIETEKREMSEFRIGQAEERARLAEESIAKFKLRSNGEVQLSGLNRPDNSELSAREKALAEMERLNNIIATTTTTAPSTTLKLEGDDGTDYGVFQYLGAQQYRADAVIHDSVARFKVAGRMYQVKVAESAVGEEYIFLYDLRDSEQPRFVAFRKGLLRESNEILAGGE